MIQEIQRPLTTSEEESRKVGTTRETIVEGRIWNKRPDGLTIKNVHGWNTRNSIWLHKIGVRTDTCPQGWLVRQRSFESGVWSLNEKDLHENLSYFKVPGGNRYRVHKIKLESTFKIFDEYTNILKGMYSVRFNGCPTDSVVSVQDNSVPSGHMTPLITSLQVYRSDLRVNSWGCISY